MNALPVLERELASVARKSGTYRVRLAVSIVGLLVIIGVLWLSPVSEFERGRQLYRMVSGLALLWAMVAGVLLTADAINDERSRGTLGLLFLTDLTPGDILVGKLAARSLNGVYALISLLPLLAVPLAFGGVMAWQVVGHSLLVMETLALSLVVGLHASTRWPEPGVAMARGLGSMGMILIALPLSLALLGGRSASHFAMCGPLGTYFYMFSRKLTAFPTAGFVMTTLIVGGLTVAFFLSAVRRLRRTDLFDFASSDRPDRAWSRSQTSVFGRAAPPPAGLIERDPIMWLLWRRNKFPRADGVFLVSVLLIGAPLALSVFLWDYGWWPVAVIALILHLAMVSHMASQSCRRVGSEEERTALELLTTTPRAARGTLESYHQAFRQLFQTQFWWLTGVYGMLFVGAIMVVPAKYRSWALLPVIALIVLHFGRYAISWVGLNASLRHARYHRALLTVQVCILFPAWGYLAVLLVMLMLRILPLSFWWPAFFGWLLPGALLPGIVGAWHRGQAVRWMQDHGGMASFDD